MSTKPHPVALTAAILAARAYRLTGEHFVWTGINFGEAADWASRLHRLAKGCRRAAEAECNGEFHPGQRDWVRQRGIPDLRGTLERKHHAALDAEITKYGDRINRSIAKLNKEMAPFAIRAIRTGDPRGFTLRLVSTDANRPLPSNGMVAGEWGIE